MPPVPWKARQRKQEEAEPRRESLATLLDPTGGASEDYRTLRTSLLYSLVDEPPKAIVITSPGPGEGKSTTCANLGVVLAQAGKRTLVVDCDLRKPRMHQLFGLRNLQGLVNVLVGERSSEEVARGGAVRDLEVVTSGSLPPNPSELLGSQRFSEFLEGARQEFDYVLLDAPPVELVSDPIILCGQADGALLVFDARNTRKGSLKQSVHNLQAVGTNVLGTVMNSASSSKGGYYYDGYAYG
ncbi:MAG: CpsD/CapB family tyrosine-protein kinase [Rubrobacter sp.]|nr:CpsD/CapB family tyrosine-protein kinase [Rubrobacter sp.]